jgi:hypothetical protein
MCFGEETKTMRVSGALTSKGSPFAFLMPSSQIWSFQGLDRVFTHLMVSMSNDARAVEEVCPSTNTLLEQLEKAAKGRLQTVVSVMTLPQGSCVVPVKTHCRHGGAQKDCAKDATQ